MTKLELIAELSAANPHLRPTDVELVVNTILAGITDALARGDKVELRGFGTFTGRHRKARIGRNPRTGVPVAVHAKVSLLFRAGKDLRERVNRSKPVRQRA